MQTPRRLPASWARPLDLTVAALVAAIAFGLFAMPRAGAPYPAPHFAVRSLGGSIYALRGAPGRVTFLDFWASWCEPCKVSLPLVERFARGHPDVDVFAVDVGEPPAVGAAYAREHGIVNVLFDASGEVGSKYGVAGYPTLVAIDRRGYVQNKWEGFNPAIEAAMAAAGRRLGAGSLTSR